MTNVLGSTHVVEQLSFSMFPSTLAFDFDLMLGSFLTFCSTFILYVSVNSGIGFYLILKSSLVFGAPTDYLWGWGTVQQLIRGLLM